FPASDGLPVAFRLFAEGGFSVGAEWTAEGFAATIESLRGEPCFIVLPERLFDTPVYAYIAPKDGAFRRTEIKTAQLGRETVLDFSAICAEETLLLASRPIEELVCAAPAPTEPNGRMKRCGKAVLGG
ncbi:MAG: hypothetical protein K6C36_04145, partial [Clostridia bacterium]|nr:hypothetical protein [Clostridia bacterium]